MKNSGLYFNVESIEDLIFVIKDKAEAIEINPETFLRQKRDNNVNGYQVTFASEPDKK